MRCSYGTTSLIPNPGSLSPAVVVGVPSQITAGKLTPNYESLSGAEMTGFVFCMLHLMLAPQHNYRRRITASVGFDSAQPPACVQVVEASARPLAWLCSANLQVIERSRNDRRCFLLRCSERLRKRICFCITRPSHHHLSAN